MSEFIFVHLIDKSPVGSEIGDGIPLHMTVLHWFETAHSQDEIIDVATGALVPIGKVATTATSEDLFGPENDIPVMKLSRTPELVQLHTALLVAMEACDATFNERWTGTERWNPHVTHKPDKRLIPGDTVAINDIDLVTRFGKDGPRKILHRFTLSGFVE